MNLGLIINQVLFFFYISGPKRRRTGVACITGGELCTFFNAFSSSIKYQQQQGMDAADLILICYHAGNAAGSGN